MPDFTTSYVFRAPLQDLWRALIGYLANVPSLQTIARDEATLQLTCRDINVGTTLRISLVSTEPEQSALTIEEFQPASPPGSAPAARLPLLTAAVRTNAFAGFKQLSGPGNAGELRWGGIGKMALGAVIGLIGLGLTAASDGQVLFYGAILTGLFMFLGGVWQTAFAQSVD